MAGLSSWLSEVWSNRIAEKLRATNAHDLEQAKAALLHEVESHKIRLKKSEFLFQKEFEAACSFSAFMRSLLPGFNHPDMEWYEVCDEIAQSFGSIEQKLEQFFSEFSVALTEEERTILSDAISDAGYSKFEVIDEDVSRESNEAAGILYDKLKDFNSKLIARVRDQTSL